MLVPLFLPSGEVHELGLMFLNYHLKSQGYKTLYLGPRVPIEDLKLVKDQFADIKWVTNIVVNHNVDVQRQLIKKIKQLQTGSDSTFEFIGKINSELKEWNSINNLKSYSSIQNYISK